MVIDVTSTFFLYYRGGAVNHRTHTHTNNKVILTVKERNFACECLDFAATVAYPFVGVIVATATTATTPAAAAGVAKRSKKERSNK